MGTEIRSMRSSDVDVCIAGGINLLGRLFPYSMMARWQREGFSDDRRGWWGFLGYPVRLGRNADELLVRGLIIS